MVHLRRAELAHVRDNDLELCTAGGIEPWAITLANDDLFPSKTVLIVGIEKFWGKTLAPLNVKLISFTQLDREIICKIQREIS